MERKRGGGTRVDPEDENASNPMTAAAFAGPTGSAGPMLEVLGRPASRIREQKPAAVMDAAVQTKQRVAIHRFAVADHWFGNLFPQRICHDRIRIAFLAIIKSERTCHLPPPSELRAFLSWRRRGEEGSRRRRRRSPRPHRPLPPRRSRPI